MSTRPSTVLVHNFNDPLESPHGENESSLSNQFLSVEAKFVMTLISVAFMEPPKESESIKYFLACEKLPNLKTAPNKLRGNTIEFYEALSFQHGLYGEGGKLEPYLLNVTLTQYSEKKNKEKDIGVASFNVADHIPLDLRRITNFVQCDVLFSSGKKKHDNIMIKVDIQCSLIRLKKGNDCYYVDREKNQMVIGEYFEDNIAAAEYLMNDGDSADDKKRHKIKATRSERKSLFIRKKTTKKDSSSEEDINIEVAKTVAYAIEENEDIEREKYQRNQMEIDEFAYNLLPEELKSKYKVNKKAVDLSNIVSALNERDDVLADSVPRYNSGPESARSPRVSNSKGGDKAAKGNSRTLTLEKPKKKPEKPKSKKERAMESKEAQIEYLKKQNESLLSQIKIFHEHENDKRQEIMEKLTKVIMQEQDEVEQSTVEVIPVVSLGLLDLFEKKKDDHTGALETPLAKMVSNLTGDAAVDRLAALELLYDQLPDDDELNLDVANSNEEDATYYEALRELEEIENAVKFGETVIDANDWEDLPENADLYEGLTPVKRALSGITITRGRSDTEVGQDANLDLANYDDFEAFLNDFTKMDEEKNEFLQESDNYINELLENELVLRTEIEALKSQNESDREIIDILKEINDDQKQVIAELEESESNLQSLLQLKLNENDGIKQDQTEIKSQKSAIENLKKELTEKDDQILRVQSERNVFQREYNRMKLELEKATGKVNPDMVLSEYSLNAKEKKNLERQQQLETEEFALQDRQTNLAAQTKQLEQQEKDLQEKKEAYEREVKVHADQLEKHRALLNQQQKELKEHEAKIAKKKEKLIELTKKVEAEKEAKPQPATHAKKKMVDIRNERAAKFQTLTFIKPSQQGHPTAPKAVATLASSDKPVRPGPKGSNKTPSAGKTPSSSRGQHAVTLHSSLDLSKVRDPQKAPQATATATPTPQGVTPAPVQLPPSRPLQPSPSKYMEPNSPRKAITRKETIRVEIEKAKAEVARRNAPQDATAKTPSPPTLAAPLTAPTSRDNKERSPRRESSKERDRDGKDSASSAGNVTPSASGSLAASPITSPRKKRYASKKISTDSESSPSSPVQDGKPEREGRPHLDKEQSRKEKNYLSKDKASLSDTNK